MVSTEKQNKLTILYQLDCGFCNWYRDFVTSRARRDEMVFIDIAGATGREWITKFNLPINPDQPDTFVVIDESGVVYYRWIACMKVGLRMRSPWRQLSFVGQFVPTILGDAVYNFISHHRRFAGRLVKRPDTCDTN